MVERKYGKARRISVFDRAILSQENLAAIRRRGGQYLTGMPRSQMKRFEADLLAEDWTRVRPEVEVKKVSIPQGEETYILCRTEGRKEKEKAIRNRFSNRMEAPLDALRQAIVTGWLKDRNKMERRLGKIQARHPQVSNLYVVEPRYYRRCRLVLADEGASQELTCGAGGRLFATHESHRGNGRGVMVQVYATDRGQSVVPGTEERAFPPALIPPIGAARESSRPGGVSRIGFVGHSENSAEEPA